MRSYIHINLCVNLFISQLIFIAGIEPRLTDNQDYVPVGCQVVAVLLHYFFLVTFMWMLMEGVVLYVVLVRVFVKYHKRYIIAFTVISYGNAIIALMHKHTYMYVLGTKYNISLTNHAVNIQIPMLASGVHTSWTLHAICMHPVAEIELID